MREIISNALYFTLHAMLQTRKGKITKCFRNLKKNVGMFIVDTLSCWTKVCKKRLSFVRQDMEASSYCRQFNFAKVKKLRQSYDIQQLTV